MKRTRNYLALLLALCMVMAMLPITAMAAAPVTVKFEKEPAGIALKVYKNLGVSAADLQTAVADTDEYAIYALEPGNYTWQTDSRNQPEGISVYNVRNYFKVSAADAEVGTKTVFVDPGSPNTNGWDNGGLKMISNFPDYPATMTNETNHVTTTIPMHEISMKYFNDPYPTGISNPDYADAWGRWDDDHGLTTPAFKATKSRHEYSTQEDLENWLATWDAYDNANNGNDGQGIMYYYVGGETEQGTPMYYVVFEEDANFTPEAFTSTDKARYFYQAQIHGNEHSAGEGALEILRRLVTKELDVLSNVSILMNPRVNMDGAYLSQRIPANSYQKDYNRDNLTFDNQETRVNHAEFQKYNPHFFLDNHEFGGNGQYTINGVKHMFCYDYELSSGKNLNIPESIRNITNNMIVPWIVPHLLDKYGMRMIEYTEQQSITGIGPVDPSFIDTLKQYKKDPLGNYVLDQDGNRITEPSTEPSRENLTLSGVTGDYFRELMPNSRHSYDALGLQLAVDFLVEIRGLGIGKENWVRRVKTAVEVNQAMIEWGFNNKDLLIDTVEATWADTAKYATYGAGADIVITCVQDFTEVRDFSAINLDTLELTTVPISFWNTQKAKPVNTRKMPTAYILPKGWETTIEYNGFASSTDLMVHNFEQYNGTEVYELPAGTTVPVEEYKVASVAIAAAPTSYEGYPRYFMGVETAAEEVTFENGAYIIPMDQKSAILIALSLEPDIDGSYVMFNKFGTSWQPGEKLPIYRYIQNNPRETFGLPAAGTNGTTNVTATVDPSYTLTVPASIDFATLTKNSGIATQSFDVTVSDLMLDAGTVLEVTVAPVNGDAFIMTTANGAELPYSVYAPNGDEALAAGAVFATFEADGTATGTATVDTALIAAAGAYNGVITFTGSIA